MQKDELIQLHTFLFQVRSHLEQSYKHNGSEFSGYEHLEITPYQVHKSKREHTLAVFTLSKGIASILSYNDGMRFEKISGRLEQMAERFMTEKEKEKEQINKI
ncbi:MAG: UPF0058 family protein [Methanobacteriota archaeon]